MNSQGCLVTTFDKLALNSQCIYSSSYANAIKKLNMVRSTTSALQRMIKQYTGNHSNHLKPDYWNSEKHNNALEMVVDRFTCAHYIATQARWTFSRFEFRKPNTATVKLFGIQKAQPIISVSHQCTQKDSITSLPSALHTAKQFHDHPSRDQR